MWVFSLESTGAECGIGRVINNENNNLMGRQDEKREGPNILRGPKLNNENCSVPLYLD